MAASWGDAFKGAIFVLIYSIVWWIVGIVFIIIGTTLSLSLSGSTGLLAMAVMGLIGAFLILFGAIASILKVAANL
ncbi:MAG: hypothetical protein ACFFD4_16860 [Candidatus Odinarchaeota archaeon]